jgi:hypothetical protein
MIRARSEPPFLRKPVGMTVWDNCLFVICTDGSVWAFAPGAISMEEADAPWRERPPIPGSARGEAWEASARERAGFEKVQEEFRKYEARQKAACEVMAFNRDADIRRGALLRESSGNTLSLVVACGVRVREVVDDIRRRSHLRPAQRGHLTYIANLAKPLGQDERAASALVRCGRDTVRAVDELLHPSDKRAWLRDEVGQTPRCTNGTDHDSVTWLELWVEELRARVHSMELEDTRLMVAIPYKSASNAVAASEAA